jgi:putative redox protein
MLKTLFSLAAALGHQLPSFPNGGIIMEARARHLGESRFDVNVRDHHVICDQPRENGGADSGMSPPEFLLVSLATCAGYYAVQYLKGRALPSADLAVSVSAQKATLPARLGSFLIEVAVPGLDERHQVGVLRAVRSCLIHNTLLNAPAIEIVVNAPSLALV